MVMCQLCEKGIHKVAISKHKKGSSGASQWPLRAQIHKKTQHPNLHVYKGMRFCSKCLRIVKKSVEANRAIPKATQAAV
jgi:hypothetical protein